MWPQAVVSWIFDDALVVIGLPIIALMILIMLFKLYLRLRIRFGPPIEPGNPHILSAFSFLVTDMGFSGPSIEQWVAETHHTYTRGDVIVDPWHDTGASPFLNIIVGRPGLFMHGNDPIVLQGRKLGFVEQVHALAEFVKGHPELLEGDFRVVKG